MFQTKGDANEAPDANLVPYENVIGRALFDIPYLGYVANYIQNPPGLYFAAGVGVILILLVFMSDMLIEEDKKAKKKGQKAKEGKKADKPKPESKPKKKKKTKEQDELLGYRYSDEIVTGYINTKPMEGGNNSDNNNK